MIAERAIRFLRSLGGASSTLVSRNVFVFSIGLLSMPRGNSIIDGHLSMLYSLSWTSSVKAELLDGRSSVPLITHDDMACFMFDFGVDHDQRLPAAQEHPWDPMAQFLLLDVILDSRSQQRLLPLLAV
ncbi:hypothetical protein D9613_004671 [Agrocybe pediades]|uniref:Uncharacterized protein n=1 Tax=Agrocybe pediades TaxID=84607 RepID=A0A8H4VQS1_9AGAR|nr:hypothetical protein D9613_004671 [Agrocybe pediades]